MAASVAPLITLCHGGGPKPVLGDPAHADLVKTMQKLVPSILRLNTPQAPRAIVVVTAHWETEQPSISSASQPPLLYDYYNFPAAAYTLKYDAPGSPEIAGEIYEAFQKAGLAPVLDAKRGWDHGVFVPMLLINPSATVPIVQVSVLRAASTPLLYAMGRALAPLRSQGVAILGSGSPSFHSMRPWQGNAGEYAHFVERNAAWAGAMEAALKAGDLEGLERWREWPNAFEMHPKGGSEHFSPLVVCAGAALPGEELKWVGDVVNGVEQKTFWWQ